MVTFCFLLASQAVFIRRVSAEIHPFEIVLFRNVFAVLFLAPIYWHFGIEGMRTRAWGLYALAFVLMGFSPLAWFLAVALMPMAEMIALTFTSPLFATIGGTLILGEIVRWRRWAAIVAGFVGAIIILRPGIEAVSPPALIALLASVFIASSALTLRRLSATENPTAIVLWTSLVITPVSAVPAAFVWTTPSLESLGWMSGLGLVSLLAHIAWVRSFAAAEVSAVMPFNFTKLLFAALFGYLFFAERPDTWMWVGASVIFAATLYTGHREGSPRPRRAPPAVVPAGHDHEAKSAAVMTARPRGDGAPSRGGRSPPVRAALWMVLSAVGFSTMTALIRHVSFGLHPFEIGFFRSVFGILLLAPWVLRFGTAHLRTRRLALHAWRGLASVGALLAYFLAVSLIPLAEAAALTFTAPLFATACAGLVLAERVGWRRWSAVVGGFAGTLIILRPGMQAVSWPAMLVLVASVFVAAEILITKALTSTESAETIVIYMGVFVTPFALVSAIAVWETPTPAQLAWILALAAAATAGHMGVARAFRLVDATAVLPIDFTKLIFVATFGYLFFDEVPDAWTWLGGVVIFSAAFYTAHREARRRAGARAKAR